MNMKTALMLFVLSSLFVLQAYDRNKSAEELENINLDSSVKTVKRSYSVQNGSFYAVSSLLSASRSDIAWFEVKLLQGDKQCAFYRSLRNSSEPERIELVFNSGNADKAEVSCILLPDALPASNAAFKEFRFVRCSNNNLQQWKKRGANNCRRVFSENGDIILYPSGKRGSGTLQTSFSTILPNTKMRFSADIKADFSDAAMLIVYCNGGKNKSTNFRSKLNSKKQETLSVDFDTADFKSISLTLRCTNGKKFKNHPVIFSNLSLIIL